ncbi:hypothetical protein [Weissella confusa]|uniref:hypothetical protein n=1 Tax=Weissella confusa TaxID=1583 RepID=UPI001FDA59E3|nr:hypothetical protein [Weissella confusa]
MVKTKDKKKRLENSKFWVAAGLTAVAVGGVTTVEPQFWDLIDDEMHQTIKHMPLRSIQQKRLTR